MSEGDDMLVWQTTAYLAAGVGVYLFWAIAALSLFRKFAGDVSRMENRNSAPVLLMGGGINLLVWLSILFMVPALLDKPLSSLGLHLGQSDQRFAMLIFVASFLLAALFLYLARGGAVRVVAIHRPRLVLLAMLVLLIVAVQEEFLFRGYIRVVMEQASGWSFLLVSTAVFVVIHFLTNKVTLPQLAGWILGGGLLGVVYLASGSLWTVVVLHFAIDAGNVLVFNITGEGALFETAPGLAEGERMLYRLISTVIILLVTLAWYRVNLT
jgi:membrane protease YdiL (CAAX protease family)